MGHGHHRGLGRNGGVETAVGQDQHLDAVGGDPLGGHVHPRLLVGVIVLGLGGARLPGGPGEQRLADEGAAPGRQEAAGRHGRQQGLSVHGYYDQLSLLGGGAFERGQRLGAL